MSAPAGFLTQCAEWLVETKPTVAQLKQARKACERMEWDAREAQSVIDRYVPEPDGPGPCGILREFGG